MMAWVAANRGVRAIGEAGDVTLPTVGWQDDPSDRSLGRPVDDRVTGRVSRLRIPVRAAHLRDASRTRQFDLSGRVTVDDGQYVLECRLDTTGGLGGDESGPGRDCGIDLACRFEGPAFVQRDRDSVVVSFPSAGPVTLGFTERQHDPATITTEPTPDGIATTISHLSAALRTTGPARSHPSMRDHPPVVELGDEQSIPNAVTESTPDTGIELRLPAELEYLFVAAPLAYYLGASVTVAEETVPRIVAPAAGVDYRFRELPTFQHGVTQLLRQVFYFDTLVRDLDVGEPARRGELLDRLDLDPDALRDCSPAERLARYFWVSEADLGECLPEWHFSTYAAPEPANARCLPYLLDSLSLVYLPESSELRGTELLERSLDDFYRSGSSATGQPVQSVDMVDPQLQAGRVHAWLAGGAPIDAFKTTPAAYENRRKYQGRRGTPLSVTVVLNDEEMADEHTAVADIYRERSADLPLSVNVREHLTRRELADVFASPNDFVHYIGHCDVNGLECRDGPFSARSLDTCDTRTFFLNACGSYHEGLELVERGSVAGAVTTTAVLDRQAAKVGTAFARLLVHGFGLEAAMQLSRRRIMMGKDYTVVGDGTYTLAPTTGNPSVLWLDECEDKYSLRCEAVTGRRNGVCYSPPFSDESYLHGKTASKRLGAAELATVLRETSLPVIYDSEFHWSTALADRIDPACNGE